MKMPTASPWLRICPACHGIEGDARIDMPEGMEALYADVRTPRYRRSFTLSGELETGQIDASLKDGVLTVRIPKRAEVRPRRIEVRAE
jgi:HSP20 family protein